MTRTEKAELEELNITPEALEARRKDLEARGITRPQTGIAPAIDQAQQIANTDGGAQPSSRKPRSDKGTKRGPIVSKEPEAAAIEGAYPVELTGPQMAQLEDTAAKLLAKVDLRPEILKVSASEWLLNARVQKHWRTLIGK